jgi:hypothetical protein
MQGITENLLGGKLREEISKLLEFSDCCITDLSAAHEVELGLLKHLLHIGKLLLLTIIKAQISSLSGRKVVSKEGEIVHKKGNISRDYLSIFGKFRFIRPSFWSKERGKMYLVDSILELPKDQTSYVLQEILLESASESDYSESVRVLNRLLDLKISAKHSERNMSKLGCLADAFYADIPIEKESEPVCFSASFDGKGVPKIKEKIEKKTSKKVATAKSDKDVSPSSTADNPKKRLGKGEKRNVMQMATVSVTSSFSPKARSKENIIKALIYSPLSKVKEGEKEDRKAEDNGILEARTNDNRWHQGIHRRAFLADQHKAVDYGIKNIRDRMTHIDSRFVVPIDAGIGLEEKVLECIKKYKLEAQFDGIILDIIHVSEYVWSAATAMYGEKSKEKFPFVKTMLEDLLDTKTIQVITQLTQIIQAKKWSEHKEKQIQKTITYFQNHQHKMDYKKFIENGYPISSALVESACGHLVKERMEQTGMRWSSQGAQDVLDARAIKQNQHTTQFMNFVRQTDKIGVS